MNIKTAKCSFVVQLISRQNETWQGTVTWVETNETQHYRSALELLRLMDDAAKGGFFSAAEPKPAE